MTLNQTQTSDPNTACQRSDSYLQLHESGVQSVSDLFEIPHVVPHLIHVHHLLLLEGLYVLVQSQQPLFEVDHPVKQIHSYKRQTLSLLQSKCF